MRTTHALLAGLLLGALAWWLMGHPGYVTQDQRMQRAQAEAKAAEPAIYRWRDDQGVLQLTDQPPPGGRKYERVALREEVNVVPMSAPDEAAPADGAAGSAPARAR